MKFAVTCFTDSKDMIDATRFNKKLSYHTGTTPYNMSVEILER